MRYRIPLAVLAAGLLAPSAFAKVTVTATGDVTTMTFAVDDVQFKGAQGLKSRGIEFKRAALLGVDGYTGVDFKIGSPEVPVIRFYADGDVTVAAGAQDRAGKFGRGQRLFPNQESRSKSALPPPFAMNDAAYQSRMMPKAAYAVEDAGSINGVQRKLVTLYPLAYAPGSGDWRLRPEFTVTVKHAHRERTVADSREIFAVVVGERFADSPSLAAYKALKERLGYIVATIRVAPTDTPETIRASLQTLYKRQDARLKHAMLVGESGDVPGKEATHIDGVTDHYYRAIDTDDYEADINGPDIGVGRVSVDSEAQLSAVLAKFTRYTEGKFAAEGWLDQVSFIATDDRYEVAEGTHNHVIETYTAPRKYMGVFPEPQQLGGDKLYAITYNVSAGKVIEVMNQGRTIIDYSGHGSNTSWAGPEISQDDVRSLTNAAALPFVIGNACITGDYRVGESFGETWQRHPAGAITYWGSMDSSYWDEDDILERAMFDAIYRDDKLAFGDVTSYALGQVWAHYAGKARSAYYWETYVTFGDPSLDLRTTKTRQVQVDGPQALPVGITTVAYTVTEGGAPVKGARVALKVNEASIDGPHVLSNLTDDEGKVSFDITNEAADIRSFSVAVSGNNTVLAENRLQIIPANDPYLAFNAYKVQDRAEQAVFVGEDATLTFNVQNLGLQPTQGGKITLAAIEGPATIVASEVIVRPLAARDTYRVEGGALAIKVAADAQSGDIVKLALKWETREGQAATVPLNLRVLRAKLALQKVDFGTPGDEGGISPGASGQVYVTVRNTGSETIVNGTLSATAGACIASVGGNLAIESLAPGAELRVATPFDVVAGTDCANGNPAIIQIAGTYQSVAASPALALQASFPVGVIAQFTQDVPGLAVPILDNATAEQAIESSVTGVVKEVGVHVKLRHSYLGDVIIRLVHPDGTQITLQDRDGGTGDDLDVIFGLNGQAVTELAKLAGKQAAGTWKVLVEDTAAQDEGTLDSVSLTLKGYLSQTH